VARLVAGGQHPVAAWVAGSLGVLAIGLFHAGPGAFGRPDGDTADDMPGDTTGDAGA